MRMHPSSPCPSGKERACTDVREMPAKTSAVSDGVGARVAMCGPPRFGSGPHRLTPGPAAG